MADLRIRNIDDVYVARLQAMAKAKGYRGLEPFLRDQMQDMAQSVSQDAARDILSARDKIWENRPPLPAGTAKQWINEERDRSADSH